MIRYIKGSELAPDQQRAALSQFVHRYTREHRPAWARKHREIGNPYPVQFASDADWLANTLFGVTKAGKLHGGVTHCQSSPTWPDNPELRS